MSSWNDYYPPGVNSGDEGWLENDECYDCENCESKHSCEDSPFYWDGESEPY